MKIGIIYTSYNCEKYVDESLEPWLRLKDEFNIIFAANSGMFRDYLSVGIEEKNEGTLRKILEKKLDFLITTSGKNLLGEDASRNMCLEYLKQQDCDILLLLDGDEIYTEDQIRGIFKFVEENPEYDGYSINFKNYTIRPGLFQYEYCHRRLLWMKRNGGISHFHFDNYFHYVENAECNSICIPKNIAYVDHYSWVNTDSRVIDKISYQNYRYSGVEGSLPIHLRCAFRLNDETGHLEFNDKFWDCFFDQVPVLHEMVGDKFCFDFEIDFDRKQNTILIKRNTYTGKIFVRIYNGDTNELIYETYMDILENIDYWIAPIGYYDFENDPNFNKFKIHITGENIDHEEYIIIKP